MLYASESCLIELPPGSKGARLRDHNFTYVQKTYAIFGALFIPMLAAVLLVLNGRSDWIGNNRNRPLTSAVLVATLLLFAYFGLLKLRKTFGL